MQTLFKIILAAFIMAVAGTSFIARNGHTAATLSPVDSTLNNCNLDMRQPIFAIDSLTGAKAIIYGKYNPAYKDVEYFGCNGVQNTFCTADSSFLKYYVYYPKNHNYTTAPLPALLLFHGGGFSDCTGIDGAAYFSNLCAAFAQRGFVVFNINYRTGNLPDIDHRLLSAQQVLATYRAVQDGRGALRSILKRQRNRQSFNDPYIVDTNKIFLGGESAGSVIALSLAYYQSQAQIDAVAPGVKAVLGSINADYYYGDTTINYFKRIKGVVNMWGNVALPLTALPDPSSFFAVNVNPPAAISFHGRLDSVAPYGITDVYFSPNKANHVFFNSESHCLVNSGPYKLYPKITAPDMYGSGSENIYSFLKKRNIPAELYLDCQMQHGLDEEKPADFKSDFGTGLTTETDVYNYIVQRSVIFFQAVVNNIANNLQATKFTECENKRFGCSTQNNNNGCRLSDSCITER